MPEESIQLHYREGSSDKLYLVELKEERSGWVVNFAYGRRGRPLNASTKTPNPIPYPVAKRKYDALVADRHRIGRE